MKSLRLILIALVVTLLGPCTVTAPAAAQGTLCSLPKVYYVPRVYLPEDNATPLFAPDSRKMV